MCGFAPRSTVRVEGVAGTQVHNVPVAGPPIQGLPQEEGVRRHAGGDENQKQEKKDNETKVGSKEEESYSYTYESEDSEEEEKEDDNDEPEEKDPLMSKTLEELYGKRVFTFIHHFAGSRDPLPKALRLEAIRQGIKIKIISVEKSNDTGDLSATEPYTIGI